MALAMRAAPVTALRTRGAPPLPSPRASWPGVARNHLAGGGSLSSSPNLGRPSFSRRHLAVHAGGAEGAEGAEGYEVQYLFDGECPLRNSEVDALKTLDRGRGLISFVDISTPDYDPSAHKGVSYEQAMGPPHAIMKDGSIVTSVEVYRQLYTAVGLGFIWRATSLPLVGRVVDWTFEMWTAQRLRLTGRGSLEEVLAQRASGGAGEGNVDKAEEFLRSPRGKAVSKLSEVVASTDAVNRFKKFVARQVAGSYDEEAVREELARELARPGVVVFSWSQCPFCLKAKKTLEDAGAEFYVRELDLEGDVGKALRCELGEATGRTSMPSVWIGGEFVGGCNDGPMGGVATLEAEGRLQGMLTACGALK